MLQLDDGWDSRTRQKLALAGALAVALSLRSSPLRVGSRLREFANKLVGYSGAALLFSGVQETSRAVRGTHDFLNSALSGAVTGGVVVGHYQGPQYRLLGIVTWGSLAAALHFANSLLRPREVVEDYLIREGLLSPEVARIRAAAAAAAAARQPFQKDVFMEALVIRDRELQELNARLAHQQQQQPAPSRPSNRDAPGAARDAAEGEDVADDDPGYLAWVRASGMDPEVVLQPSGTEGEDWLSISGSGADAVSDTHALGRGPAQAQQPAASGAAASGGAPPAKRTWLDWLGLRRRRRAPAEAPADTASGPPGDR